MRPASRTAPCRAPAPGAGPGTAASEVVPRFARAGAGGSSSQAPCQTDAARTYHEMTVYPRAETAKAAGQAASGVPAQPSLPELEEGVLAYWAANGTFGESVARPAGRDFVFYDGPPFANGLPHYGHLITGYVKDVVPRFRTMHGDRVARRFGWDCHGLPAGSRRNGCSASPARPRSSRWGSRSSMTPAASRCCATPANGATT